MDPIMARGYRWGQPAALLIPLDALSIWVRSEHTYDHTTDDYSGILSVSLAALTALYHHGDKLPGQKFDP